MVGDFVLAILLIGSGLLALFLQSAKKDCAADAQKSAQFQKEQAAALEESRKHQPGTRLLCLGCETRFLGPLTDAGCPRCHLLSLIVTEQQSSEPSV